MIAGTSVTLHCAYGASPLNWAVAPASGSAGGIIVASCNVVGGFAPFYDVDTSDGGCNLIIRSATSVQAGTYTCQENMGLNIGSSAIVVVLGE